MLSLACTHKCMLSSSFLLTICQHHSDLLPAMCVVHFGPCGLLSTVFPRVVRSPAEIYGLMERGGTVRATGETKMNEASSRSHAVFIVIAEQSETVYVDDRGAEVPCAACTSRLLSFFTHPLEAVSCQSHLHSLSASIFLFRNGTAYVVSSSSHYTLPSYHHPHLTISLIAMHSSPDHLPLSDSIGIVTR